MAPDQMLVPEMQQAYCMLHWPDLHLGKKAAHLSLSLSLSLYIYISIYLSMYLLSIYLSNLSIWPDLHLGKKAIIIHLIISIVTLALKCYF